MFVHACAEASSRRHSEDRVVVLALGDVHVVVVADGAGGRAGGAAAAEAFVGAVTKTAQERRELCEPIWLRRLFVEVDAELASKMTGETTAIVVVASAFGIIGASVGDSEAWVVGASGNVDDLTGEQVKRRLGSGRAEPVVFTRPRLDGVLVAGTDGLFTYAAADKIAAAARADAVENAAAALVRLVRLPSGDYPDDVAVAVLTRVRAG